MATRRNYHGGALVFCYRLSAANVRNLLAERGLDVSRQSVVNWVQKVGVFLAEAERRHVKPLGWRWFLLRGRCLNLLTEV